MNRPRPHSLAAPAMNYPIAAEHRAFTGNSQRPQVNTWLATRAANKIGWADGGCHITTLFA